MSNEALVKNLYQKLSLNLNKEQRLSILNLLSEQEIFLVVIENLIKHSSSGAKYKKNFNDIPNFSIFSRHLEHSHIYFNNFTPNFDHNTFIINVFKNNILKNENLEVSNLYKSYIQTLLLNNIINIQTIQDETDLDFLKTIIKFQENTIFPNPSLVDFFEFFLNYLNNTFQNTQWQLFDDFFNFNLNILNSYIEKENLLTPKQDIFDFFMLKIFQKNKSFNSQFNTKIFNLISQENRPISIDDGIKYNFLTKNTNNNDIFLSIDYRCFSKYLFYYKNPIFKIPYIFDNHQSKKFLNFISDIFSHLQNLSIISNYGYHLDNSSKKISSNFVFYFSCSKIDTEKNVLLIKHIFKYIVQDMEQNDTISFENFDFEEINKQIREFKLLDEIDKDKNCSKKIQIHKDIKRKI